jgi:hypothetical protein
LVDLGNVATFDGAGNVTRLTFQGVVAAPDGNHNFGFTSGFTNFQVTSVLGLNLNNYWAFLTTNFGLQAVERRSSPTSARSPCLSPLRWHCSVSRLLVSRQFAVNRPDAAL